MKNETLKLAQEPVHNVQSNGRHSPLLTHMMNKRTAAQPAQEPVEYQMRILGNRWTHCAAHLYDEKNPNTRALYTIPPQREWVGLTDDEVNNLAAGCHLGKSVQGAIYEAAAKLKEKNT